MKKKLFQFIILLLAFNISAKKKIDLNYTIPAFEKENSIIVDTFSFPKIPDYDTIFHASYNVKGIFQIFYHNGTEWKYCNDINIQKYGEKRYLDYIENPLKYRYIAIVYDDKDLSFEFKSESRDLNIYITKQTDYFDLNGTIINTGFYLLDYKNLKNDAEDYIILENNTNQTNFYTTLYVFDKKNGYWEKAGKSYLKQIGEKTRIIHECREDLDSYNLIVLIVDNNMTFKCEAKADHNDLYITLIQDKETKSNNTFSIDIKHQLEELKSYYDSGLIDEQEYKLKKSKILGI